MLLSVYSGGYSDSLAIKEMLGSDFAYLSEQQQIASPSGEASVHGYVKDFVFDSQFILAMQNSNDHSPDRDTLLFWIIDKYTCYI